MTKKIFLKKLRRELSGLPRAEITERIGFYTEMIDDKMEDGMTEAEAIDSICTSDPIGSKVKTTDVDLDARPKRTTTEIVLLVLGFPVWFSVLAAGFAVAVALIAALWSVVVVFWETALSTAVAAPCAAIASIFCLFSGNVAMFGMGMAAAPTCAGVAIIFYYIAKYFTIASAKITVWTFRSIAKMFKRKEII